MGLLAAVRQWYKRDHTAEQVQWMAWMQHIADRVKGLPSLTAEVVPAEADLSNRCATLRIRWDANKINLTGTELAARLDAGTPRIVLAGAMGHRPEMMQSGIGVTSYMMEAGQEKIIADALHEALTNPGTHANPEVPTWGSGFGSGTLVGEHQISSRGRRTAVRPGAEGQRPDRGTARRDLPDEVRGYSPWGPD